MKQSAKFIISLLFSLVLVVLFTVFCCKFQLFAAIVVGVPLSICLTISIVTFIAFKAEFEREKRKHKILEYFNNYTPKIDELDYETYTNSIKNQIIYYCEYGFITLNQNSFNCDGRKSAFPIYYLKIIDIKAEIGSDDKILIKILFQDISTSPPFQWFNTSTQIDFKFTHIDDAKMFFKIIKNIIAIVKIEERKHGIDTKKLTPPKYPTIQADISVGKELKTNNCETIKKQNPTKKKSNNGFETIDKCTSASNIIRIEYKDNEAPENATIVTLKNNHKFSAEDYLSVYGYQTQKTAKLQYFFFLDKSRSKKNEHGNIIYPAIKISSTVIVHFPDLTTEEARKYIAISYAERATKNYYVPAEEIDDLTHYWSGKQIYEEQQKIKNPDYCVIDIETTGLSRTSDQIIEISAVRVRANEITDTFTSLVKPTISIPASATQINGITNDMVKNAPPLKEVLAKFVEFVGNDIVIGHNIGNFDLEYISRACANELNKSFDNDYIDTYPLARSTFSGIYDYKLSTLCRELGITQSTHRAEADCISTKELYDKIKAKMISNN
ncbi:MAG: 3'-5' exonuclease [Clostridiales bacterium]|nr:3'-5' exonuclease [Clostridiales bacterium]